MMNGWEDMETHGVTEQESIELHMPAADGEPVRAVSTD
jgi:hypothetical protein